MLRVSNLNFLRTSFNHVYEKIKEIEKEGIENRINVFASKNGSETASLDAEGYGYYIHSRYMPEYEAGKIIDSYGDIEEYSHILFFGAGFGYHIEEFARRHPQKTVSVFEPSLEMFCRYLSTRDFSSNLRNSIRNLGIGDDEKDIVNFLFQMVPKQNEKILIIELPVYRSVYADAYKKFFSLYKKIVSDNRSSISVNFNFQKRWIVNSIVNFGKVLSSPNILMSPKEQFKVKPAIIVSAGPSLNDEIENLKEIKEKGLAYIFSVGSSINALVENNIHPHAALTYDPTELNQKVFIKVKQKKINDIPLIFGSSVGYQTLYNYPGPVLHTLTSQDSVSGYYLKSEDGKPLDGVNDAPSIAVVALQLLQKLGFSPIIFVGQNLAFRDDEVYAKSINMYGENILKTVVDSNKKTGLKVKDVYGNEVYTSESYNRMRLNMENVISLCKNTEFLNTTKSGADIKGAPFMPMEEMLEKRLKERAVKLDIASVESIPYDMEHLTERAKKMDEEYKEIGSTIKQIEDIMVKILKLSANRNFSQVEKMYKEMDKVFEKFIKNSYLNVFILPMNRVYYGFLKDEITASKKERNPAKRAEMIVTAVGKFIEVCVKDINAIAQIYSNMSKIIKQHLLKASGYEANAPVEPFGNAQDELKDEHEKEEEKSPVKEEQPRDIEESCEKEPGQESEGIPLEGIGETSEGGFTDMKGEHLEEVKSHLNGKKVLVTGADGFIGSHLVERLIELGAHVKAFVMYNSFGSWGWLDTLDEDVKQSIEVFAGDIRDENAVRKAADGMDIVFHLAALIAIPYSYTAPYSYVDTNVKGTLNIMQACREVEVERVVHTSTSETYGTARYVPIDEEHPLQGQSPYSASKIGGDMMAESYYRSFGVPVSIIRPFNTYGPRQSARAVIPTIISQIAAGASKIKLGALHPTRDLNYVKDTVEGFIKIALSEKSIGTVINIGTGKEISIGDLAEKIIGLMGRDVKIVCDEQRLRPEKSEVERLCANNSKALELAGWQPSYTLEQGLKETIAWIEKNSGYYKSGIYNV